MNATPLHLAVLRGPISSPNCASCPFSKNGQPGNAVPGEGPQDPLWIAVGEGPGENERRERRPFIGQSGKMLMAAMAKSDVKREQIWITNALLCTPPGASDAQKEKARECCAPRLRDELARFPGKPLLLLGAVAARTLRIDEQEPLPVESFECSPDTISPDGAVVWVDERKAWFERQGNQWVPVKRQESDDFVSLEPDYESSDAITDLLREAKISQIAGSLFERNVDGTGLRLVIPTIHPAAILRGGAGDGGSVRSVDLLVWNLIADVGKVHRLATGKQAVFGEDIQTEIYDPFQADKLLAGILKECIEHKFMALDLETVNSSGEPTLRTHEAKIKALGVGHPGRSVCVLWSLLMPATIEMFRQVLLREDIELWIHNRLYDVPVLHRNGFRVKNKVHCTLIGHHAVFPGLPHDLQRVTTQLHACPPWKMEFRGKGETPASLTRYCALDTLAAARNAGPLRAWIDQWQVRKAYEAYSSNADVATRMMLCGIPFDPRENSRLDKLFAEVVEQAMISLLSSAGDLSIRDTMFQQIAMEQAKQARKDDPPDYVLRVRQRLNELRVCGSCHGHGRKSVKNARCVCEHSSTKNHPNGGACNWQKHVKGQSAPQKCPCTKYEPWSKPCENCNETGVEPFIWNPNAQVHVVGLLRARGVPLNIETEKGKISTQRLILEQLRRFREVGWLLDHRDADKMLSTFVRKVRASAVMVTLDEHDNVKTVLRRCVKRDEGIFIYECICGWRGEDMGACPKCQLSGPWMLFPRIKVHMITMRWAFEDPMMQNWPRANRKRKRPNLRAQIVAPEGHVIVGFDFEKQEARAIGYTSGDPFLCANVGKLHEICAREVWPPRTRLWCNACSQSIIVNGHFESVSAADRAKLAVWGCTQHPEEFVFGDVIGFRGKKHDPELYDFVKRLEYGAFYEGSPETLHQNLLKDDPKVRIEDIARGVAVIKDRMKHVGLWQARKRSEVARPPFMLRGHLLGAMRIWPLGNASPTEVANWDIQTMGAELMAIGFQKLEAWMLERYGKEEVEAWYPRYPNGFAPIAQVHDAAYFVGPKEKAADMKAAIEACFPQEYTNPKNNVTMPFPIETKVARSLADA